MTSNDRTRPSVNLFISGIAWEPVEAPSMAHFVMARDATNLNSHVFKIINHTDTPLSLSDPQSTNSLFSAVLKTNVPGQEFALTISGGPPVPSGCHDQPNHHLGRHHHDILHEQQESTHHPRL